MSDSPKCTKTHMGRMTFLAPEFPLTAELVAVLKNKIDDCLENGEIKISIGFKDVPFVDSAGLEALIDGQEKAMEKGGELKIVHPNITCKEILIATRLNERFGL